MLVTMNLVPFHGHSQDTRTIKGEILSSESSPVPGLAVLQLGTDNAVVTDINGQFELIVEEMGEVYLHVFGLDLEIFLKFQQGEDAKTVHLGDWKQLKRNNKKISHEWTARNQN